MKSYLLLEQMFRLSVHDRHGGQWLPLFGYDNQVCAYAPGREAIAVFNRIHFGEDASVVASDSTIR